MLKAQTRTSTFFDRANRKKTRRFIANSEFQCKFSLQINTQ